MSQSAIRLQQMRHLRSQLQGCLANWPPQTERTRARVARVSRNISDLSNEMRLLAGRVIADGVSHGH